MKNVVLTMLNVRYLCLNTVIRYNRLGIDVK